MKIAEIKVLVPVLLKHRVVPFLWGQQGMGKSQVVKQLAAELGVQLIHLDLSALEPADLIGVMAPSADGKSTHHLRPDWFPTEGNGIIFLDEFNRMHPDVMQTMMTFITERRMHRHKLPEGWGVVSAGNYNNNSFNVTDTSDAALVSRFCHVDFRPTIEEFILFAESRGAKQIADFIRVHPEMLEKKIDGKEIFNMIGPDRRSWFDWLHPLDAEKSIEDFRYEVYSGIVGQAPAAAYLNFLRSKEEKVSGRKILEEYDKVRPKIMLAFSTDENRFDLVNPAVEELDTIWNQPKYVMPKEELENLKRFMLDIPLELSQKVANKIQKSRWLQKNEILNDGDFVNKFEKLKLKKKED